MEKLKAFFRIRFSNKITWKEKHLVELNDVRMAEEFQILDLPSDLANHVQVLDFLSVEDFDGNLVAGELVEADLDLAKE